MLLGGKNMKTEKVVLIVIAVTLVIAALQAVQLMSLKSQIADNELVLGTSSGSASSTVQVAGGGHRVAMDTQIDITNLPDQVGGCF